MKTLYLFTAICICISLNAQDYDISFSATGASSVIETIEVKNITQGTTKTLGGTDVLRLARTETGINLPSNSDRIKVYPNTGQGNYIVEYNTTTPEQANVQIINALGKIITTATIHFSAGNHKLNIENLSGGFYCISINNKQNTYSQKLVSNNSSAGKTTIHYQGTTQLKSAAITQWVEMKYDPGDWFVVKASSGAYSTIRSFIPTSSILKTFEFVQCTDGDNNNYSVVKIGDQTWMAENLKTTKNANGASIDDIYSLGNNSNDAAYCIYNDNANNEKETYGALYTYKAATEACPTNWHLPSQAEWEELSNKIKSDGYSSLTGTVLKTTNGWSNNGNGTDIYGFSALPAGMYGFSNDFYYLGQRTFWWTSTVDINVDYAIEFYIYGTKQSLDHSDTIMSACFSVRCVRDE